MINKNEKSTIEELKRKLELGNMVKSRQKSDKKYFYFIANDSMYYAKEVINKIIAKSKNLNRFPEIRRKVPEINHKHPLNLT